MKTGKNTVAEVINMADHHINLQNNGELLIALGKSRFETKWKNKKMLWSGLLSKLSKSVETPETHAEYMHMSKEQQDKIKDIGGFVGGHLKEGRRKTGYVLARQILTLDLDFPPADFWDALMNNLELDAAMAVYSTHKYSEKTPRFRLIMPLDREVTPDEYEAIARKIAEKIGIDYFDDSTYQPTRLMYWPSNSTDVVPFFKYYDAPFLKADSVLAEYPDWTDTSFWPESSRMTGIRKKQADKQGDPLEKKGIVGAFCRTYTIPEAIEKFLPDVYIRTAKDDRYTYAQGSTAAGLVVYDGETFAYSNHSTDPASGQLCNAFDLVRIHKFGDLDDGSEDKNGKDRPSYKAMADYITQEDDATKLTLARDTKERAVLDFEQSAPEETDEDWETKLSRTEDGAVRAIITNAVLILQNQPELQGIRFNELSGAIEVKGKLPWKRPNKYWRDADDAQLYGWVADQYGVQFPENKFTKALTIVTDQRRFNPLKEYLAGLPEWDGVPRVDTLLIDYLGAEDTAYTRAVTRKTLIGAVQRVWEPGCKFDTVLVLDGKPGIGKSTLLRKLGGKWFSDSLSLADTRDKTAAEKLQGVWIMEIGEMQGTRKADVDIMKGFISRQVDEYRAAYGRVVERHPRTAIICGTTNSTTGFLRDTTGNRRFWPVPVSGGKKSVWDMTEDIRAQIWAETIVYATDGEDSFLDAAMEKEAEKMQQAALEYDEREGQVEEYLETLLPADWYSWDLEKRVDYFQQRDVLSPKEAEGTMKRTKVCAMEIFCECFGRPKNAWKKADSWEIMAIMARIPEWEKTGKRMKISEYGQQRPYTRKLSPD